MSTDGANQIVSGTADRPRGQLRVGSFAVNLDSAPPALTVLSPADDRRRSRRASPSPAPSCDALSGIASATCNGAPAAVTTSQLACGLTLAPGPSTLTVATTDTAGNTATLTQSIEYKRVPVVTHHRAARISSYVNISPTTVTGTVDDRDGDGHDQSIPAVVANGMFTLALPLAEGPEHHHRDRDVADGRASARRASR